MAVSSTALAPTLPWNTPQGATPKTRHDIQTWARRALQSPAYRERVEKDLIAGSLNSSVEIMLYHYAFGKPVENVKVTVGVGEEDYTQMSLEELQERLQRLSGVLDEALELESAIPAQYRID